MSGTSPLVTLNISVVWRLRFCIKTKQIYLCLEVLEMLTVFHYILCKDTFHGAYLLCSLRFANGTSIRDNSSQLQLNQNLTVCVCVCVCLHMFVCVGVSACVCMCVCLCLYIRQALGRSKEDINGQICLKFGTLIAWVNPWDSFLHFLKIWSIFGLKFGHYLF